MARDWLPRDPTTAGLVLSEVRDFRNSRYALALLRDVVTQPLTFAKHDLEGAKAKCFSPDLQHMLVVGRDGAQVWKLDGTGRTNLMGEHLIGAARANFSWSGDRLATFSNDGIVRVWTVPQPSEPMVLKGDAKNVVNGWFDFEEERVLAVLKDGSVLIWQLNDNREPQKLEPFQESRWRLESASIDDRNGLIAASNTAQMFVWDYRNSDKAVKLERNPNVPQQHSFSPDCDRLLGIQLDSPIIWKTDGTGKPVVLEKVVYQKLDTTVAKFSPDGNLVLTAASDGLAKLWKADGTGGPFIFRGHQRKINAAEFTADGSRIVTASDDGMAMVWIVVAPGRTSEDARADPLVLRGHAAPVIDVRMNPAGDRVVTVAEDGELRIWYVGDVRDPVTLRANESARVLCMQADETGVNVLASSDRRIGREKLEWMRWDGNTLRRHAVANDRKVRPSGSFGPRGNRLALAFDDGMIELRDFDNRDEPAVLGTHEGVNAVHWSPDGRRILTASRFGGLRMWLADGSEELEIVENGATAFSGSELSVRVIEKKGVSLKSGELRIWDTDGTVSSNRLNADDDWATIMAISRDGSIAATAGATISDNKLIEDTISLWDVANPGRRLRIFEGHTGAVEAISFSPSGDRIISAAKDHTARIWGVDKDIDPIVLPHDRWVVDASFSPEGDRVVTASYDNTARVWSADGTGVPIVLQHPKNESGVYSAKFDTNGERIITRTLSAVRIWSMTPEELRSSVRELTAICLDPEFREKHLGEDPEAAKSFFEKCTRLQQGWSLDSRN